MACHQAWPEPLILRLDARSLRGFAKLQRGSGELQVFVPYTSPELTRAALEQAAVLTRNLAAHITLFAVHVIPFPLPLNKPGVSAALLEQKVAAVAHEASTQVDIRVVCARDSALGSKQILMPNSLVVMATKKRWWPTAEVKLAGVLARAGHSVALLGV
jgi:hypothetical protein